MSYGLCRGLAGEADEHVEGEKVEKRHHGGDGDRDQRDAALPEQAAGDRKADEGVPARRALEDRGEARAVDAEPALQHGPERQHQNGHGQDRADQRPADAERPARRRGRPATGCR